MWISKQMRRTNQGTDADLGITTIAGERMGVMTRGEVRALPVYGPGGYAWMPAGDSGVLVIKGGPGGEEQCVAGVEQTCLPDMQPGEICITGPGGSRIYLKKDGEIQLQGRVSVLGTLTVNGEEYRPCSCEEGI